MTIAIKSDDTKIMPFVGSSKGMKNKIKTLTCHILKNEKNKLLIKDLSIYISVILSVISLKIHKKNFNSELLSKNFNSNFQEEFKAVEKRFPILMDNYFRIDSKLSHKTKNILFNDLIDIFSEIDDDFENLISWTYQFMKSDLEKIVFAQVGKNKVKIKGLNLLVTTQFFTDRYMVKFLVDESLCDLTEEELKNVVIIDPASGGGNFLNYSFERLYKLYKMNNSDWSNKKIVDHILTNSLIGYDLDGDLSSIAMLSLYIKASKYAIPSKSTPIYVYGGVEEDKFGFLNDKIISNEIKKTTMSSLLEKVEQQQKIKIFLTNPPFMGIRDMDIDLKKYLVKKYPESKGDLCVSFIQKIIQTMNKQDIVGVVSQNNWMYLSSLSDFRKMLLKTQTVKKCMDLGSNSFEDLNGEKTNVALCILEKLNHNKSSLFYNLKYKSLSEKSILIEQDSVPQNITYVVNQNQFFKNNKYEFSYHLEDRFENLEKLELYTKFGRPMQGTSTGNNKEFIKYAWEVGDDSDWKLVSKGGGFSRWVGVNYYKVLWGIDASIIKLNKGSALRNINKIPLTSLVYSDTGSLGLNVRILKKGQVFISSGPGVIIKEGNKYAHLAFLNSRIVTFLLKLINPKFTISAGYIGKIPVAPNILNSKKIIDKSKKCLQLKESYLQKKLPNYEFKHIDYTYIKNIDKYIMDDIMDDIKNDYNRLLLESQIEKIINKEYNLSFEEKKEIKSIAGESPFFSETNKVKINIKELDSLLADNIDINCFSKARRINGFVIGSESIFEDLSYRLNIHPSHILDMILNNIEYLEKTKNKYYDDFLHKLLLQELKLSTTTKPLLRIVNLETLIDYLKSKYLFLNNIPELKCKIIYILTEHHKVSFFNKPLMMVKDNNIIIGK